MMFMCGLDGILREFSSCADDILKCDAGIVLSNFRHSSDQLRSFSQGRSGVVVENTGTRAGSCLKRSVTKGRPFHLLQARLHADAPSLCRPQLDQAFLQSGLVLTRGHPPCNSHTRKSSVASMSLLR